MLAAHTTAPPHRTKKRIPPGPEAWAAAEALRAQQQPANPADAEVVVDLAGTVKICTIGAGI